MGEKHVIHHKGDPRPDGPSVWAIVAITGGAVWAYLAFVAILPWLLLTAAGVGVVGGTWAIYKHFTQLKRLTARADKICILLQENLVTLQTARESFEKLTDPDRRLADVQLKSIHTSGALLCKELDEIGKDVKAIKVDLMQKLGKVPADDLNKKLEPLNRIEEIIKKAKSDYQRSTRD